MKIGTHTTYTQRPPHDTTVAYAMTVEDTPTPILTRMLRLPSEDLTTGRSGILAEPLQPGHTRLLHARHLTMASDAAMRTVKAFGVSLAGAAVMTGVCLGIAPIIGPSALAINGAAGLCIILALARTALRERVMADAMRGIYLLAEAHEQMATTASDADMAILFADKCREAVSKAHVLGMVDDRILPAVRQYVAAYNVKFVDGYEVL